MKTTIFFVGMLFAISAAASAQLPKGGDENRKDMPGRKVETSTDSVKKQRIEVFDYEEKGAPRKGIRFLGIDGKEKKRILESGGAKKIGEKWYREAVIVGNAHEKNDFVLVETRKSEHDFDPGYERDSAAPGEYWDETVEVYNADGKLVTSKTFRTYPGEDLLTTSYWKSVISNEGRHFFVYYRDEKGGGNVEVYKVTGELLAHGRADGDVEGVDISPDGSLVAGYVYLREGEDTVRKGIWVLEANTREIKMTKAEGSYAGRHWTANFAFKRSSKEKLAGKIWLGLEVSPNFPSEKVVGWSGNLRFTEIPESLSDFFAHGDKK